MQIFPTYTIIITAIYLFAIFLYTSILASTNNCSVDLYNGNPQTTTIFYMQLHTGPQLFTAFFVLLFVWTCLSWTTTRTFLKWKVPVLACSITLLRLYFCLCIMHSLLFVRSHTCLTLFPS